MVLSVSLQVGSEAGAGVPREGACGLALDWPPQQHQQRLSWGRSCLLLSAPS